MSTDSSDAIRIVSANIEAGGLDADEPDDLTPTGINGGGRVDGIYVTAELWKSGAVRSYAQKTAAAATTR